jgi:signal transduction histidine kinase
MIERVSSNSERLLNLINSVLDVAKIEAGRLEIQSEPLDPRQLIQKWQTQMSVLAQKKGLSLDVDIDPSLPRELYGDSERLSQIGINLLSNAVKFTEKGGVKLSVGCSDSSWSIQVADTGIGIPPHALNYIFDEFRQVDGSTSRVYGGSGLGLAIVRNLCGMMDGNIKVASELDKGSIFTVTLPLKPVLERIAA